VLVVQISRGEFKPELLPLLLFTVIGGGLFAAGLWMVTRVRTTVFDGTAVSVDSVSIFGRKQWTEPLQRFKGILSRSEYHSGGKNSASYTLYIVELFHDDRKKRINLYESRRDEGLRGIQEDYCRKLNMPALEGEGTQMVVRAVEDLDKSVRELAREGKLEVAFNPSATPPADFVLRPGENRLEIEINKHAIPFFGTLLMLLIPGVFIYLGFFIEGAPFIFGVVGVIFLLVFIAAIIWSCVARQVVHVSPAELHAFYRTPWGETGGTKLVADRIESVHIGNKTQGQGQSAVLLTSDQATLSLGAGLPPASQEWLKNCILAVITR